jgi:hypothetical protein
MEREDRCPCILELKNLTFALYHLLSALRFLKLLEPAITIESKASTG